MINKKGKYNHEIPELSPINERIRGFFNLFKTRDERLSFINA
jgi:hypothetical protein